MQHSIFLVDDTPYCAWGWELQKTNLEFLDHIDPTYFAYQANTHFANIEGENKSQAATALRTSYHHGLESFFALICAALQAPDCVVGWFEKYQVHQIRKLVSIIASESGPISNTLGLGQVSWEALSSRINKFAYPDEDKLRETQQLFGKLWKRLAQEFLNEVNSKEYNHIKHGARAKPGGFFLRCGEEHEEGVAPSNEEMTTLGGSKFGTYFFIADRVKDAPRVKEADPHFRLIGRGVNWDPESLAHALCLISLSIQNVISFLKIINGVSPQEVRFSRPEDSDYFEQPWKRSVGVTSMSMDFYPVQEQHITRYGARQLREQYKIKTSRK
jgi:hypothetical protein